MKKFENAWNEYWSSGLLTSCASNGSDNYPLSIQSFWKEKVFTHIKNKDTVVDLCSGGGGIPKLLLEQVDVKSMELTINITDLADISENLASVGNVDINYIPNCNCESLPIKDNKADLVTSSYGIEYSNLELTIKEIYRVLKDKGVFAAVFHCQGSEIVKNSENQLHQANRIINEYKFFECFKRIYISKNRSKVLYKNAEKKLLAVLDKMRTEMIHDNKLNVYRMVLDAAHDIFVFGQANSAIECIKYINQTESALKSNLKRMENLLNIVLSDKDIKKLITEIKPMNFKVVESNKIVSAKEHVLGHGLVCVVSK